MRVADTSALFALFVADDARHQDARRAFATGEPMLVPAEILAETMLLLERRVSHEAARQAGSALRGLPNVEIQPTWDEPWENVLGEAWKQYGSKRLSYADAVVVAWCRKRRLKPLTFDREVAKAAG